MDPSQDDQSGVMSACGVSSVVTSVTELLWLHRLAPRRRGRIWRRSGHRVVSLLEPLVGILLVAGGQEVHDGVRWVIDPLGRDTPCPGGRASMDAR